MKCHEHFAYSFAGRPRLTGFGGWSLTPRA
jgi:hypothetical protein